MKTWYEVFITDEKGSRTLEIYDTLKEAKAFKENMTKKKTYTRTLHIDKWQDMGNPEIVKRIS